MLFHNLRYEPHLYQASNAADNRFMAITDPPKNMGVNYKTPYVVRNEVSKTIFTNPSTPGKLAVVCPWCLFLAAQQQGVEMCTLANVSKIETSDLYKFVINVPTVEYILKHPDEKKDTVSDEDLCNGLRVFNHYLWLSSTFSTHHNKETNVNLSNVLNSFAKHFFPVHGTDAMGKEPTFDIPTAYQRKLKLCNSASENKFKRGEESEE